MDEQAVGELIELNANLSSRLESLQARILQLQDESPGSADIAAEPSQQSHTTNVACCVVTRGTHQHDLVHAVDVIPRYRPLLRSVVACMALGTVAAAALSTLQLQQLRSSAVQTLAIHLEVGSLQQLTFVIAVGSACLLGMFLLQVAREQQAHPPHPLTPSAPPPTVAPLQAQALPSSAPPPTRAVSTADRAIALSADWAPDAACDHARLLEACALVDTLAAGNYSAQARHAAEVALMVLPHVRGGDPPCTPFPVWRLHGRLARVCFRRVIVDRGELRACNVNPNTLGVPVPAKLLDRALSSPLLQQSPRAVSAALGGGNAAGPPLPDWLNGSWLGSTEASSRQHASVEETALSPTAISELLHRGKAAAAAGVAASAGACPLSHKMAALCGNQLATLEGQAAQVAFAPVFREHLDAALQASGCSPEDAFGRGAGKTSTDPETFHMLGRWGYELSRLTWFEKRAASAIYGELPEVQPEQVLAWLQHAAKAQPPLRDLEGVLAYGRMCSGQDDWMPAQGSTAHRLCSRPRWIMNELWLAKCEHAAGNKKSATSRVQGVLQDCSGGLNSPEEAYVSVDAGGTLAKWGGV